MTRRLTRDGNVIAVDFGPRKSFDLDLAMTATVLHQDERVIVTRYDFTLAGTPMPAFTQHFMADLTTGRIVHL